MTSLLFIIYNYRPVISGFRCQIDDICVLLCYYAESSGNFLPTFRHIYRPDSLSRNLGKKLPLLAA